MRGVLLGVIPVCAENNFLKNLGKKIFFSKIFFVFYIRPNIYFATHRSAIWPKSRYRGPLSSNLVPGADLRGGGWGELTQGGSVGGGGVTPSLKFFRRGEG